MNPVHRGQLPKEPLINSRLLSPNYGVCGKAPCEGNVEHIGEKGNEVHRPRSSGPSGVYRACPDCVVPLANVLDIACGTRLARTSAINSELS
jgi:hypothetical protein